MTCCGFRCWYLLVGCGLLLYLWVGLCGFVGCHLSCGLVGLGVVVVDVGSCLFCADVLWWVLLITWMFCCLIWWMCVFEL